MCSVLRSDQIAAVSLRACYPEFIWLKWLVLCSEPASAGRTALCTKPAQQQTEPTATVWTWLIRALMGLASPEGDLLFLHCRRIFSRLFAAEVFFTAFVAWGSLCSVNVEAVNELKWVWYTLSASVMLCCSAGDPLTDVQAAGSCHSPVTSSEWWKSGSGRAGAEHFLNGLTS